MSDELYRQFVRTLFRKISHVPEFEKDLKKLVKRFSSIECVFRSNSGRYSAPIQAAVPLQIRPPFRSISGTL